LQTVSNLTIWQHRIFSDVVSLKLLLCYQIICFAELTKKCPLKFAKLEMIGQCCNRDIKVLQKHQYFFIYGVCITLDNLYN